MRPGQVPVYGKGQCSGCGKPKDTVGTYCKACRSAYSNEWNKAKRRQFKEMQARLAALEGSSTSETFTETA